MKKIPTLFVRDETNRALVVNLVTPGCCWVIAGEGIPTRKFDGTCCMVRDGKLYKRYEYTCRGKDRAGGWLLPKSVPAGYESASEFDPLTGKQFGWVPVGDGPEDKWHREAWQDSFEMMISGGVGHNCGLPDGTYELLGPKVQGNPEGFQCHSLVAHGSSLQRNGIVELPGCPRDFDGLKAYLAEHDIEGIVWHHPDGRMCKVKKRDFGFKR